MGLSKFVNILFFIVLVAIFICDRTSYLFFGYSFFICLIVNFLFCKSDIRNNIATFLFYTIIAVILYSTHKIIIPDYLGLTGPEGGVGTDDCRYYAQLVNGQVPYDITFNFFDSLPFSLFLKFCLPFEIDTPLNVAIFNVLGICFLPYLTSRLLLEFTSSKKTANDGYLLVLLCPFTTYYGCIIMRDMWIASAVLLGLLLFIRKRYFGLSLTILFICFIRFGSIVFLMLSILVMIRERMLVSNKNRTKANINFFCFIMLVYILFCAFFPIISILSEGRLEEGLIRLSFVDYLKTDDENALIVKILNLPFPLNILLTSVFFFFLPFLKFDIYTLGFFNIGNVLKAVFTPVFFFPYWKYLIFSIVKYLKGKDEQVRPFFLISLCLAVALGTISLQARHKTVLIPFMCMLFAYGKNNYHGSYCLFSFTIATGIVMFELVYAFFAVM